MNDIDPSLDMYLHVFEELYTMADSAGGTLALTAKGRIIIYGVDDADDVAKRLNTKGSGATFYVEVIGPATLGINLA